MAATYWIKLYHEILDDPKMGRLPDHLFRRAIEMFLLAGSEDNGGYLPKLADMAWRLHTGEEDVLNCLEALSKLDIVEETDDGWLVVHFSDRQDAASNAERQARYRSRRQKSEYYNATDNETNNGDVTKRNVDIDKDIDTESDIPLSGETAPDFLSITPLEAKRTPGIRQFCDATGRYPGKAQLPIVWRRCKAMTVEQMRPAWEEWVSRGYRVDNLGWLDWVTDGIPARGVRDGPPKKNGKISDAEFLAAMQTEADRIEREGL